MEKESPRMKQRRYWMNMKLNNPYLDGVDEIPDLQWVKETKVHVFGSISFSDFPYIANILEEEYSPFFLISGGADGADSCAELYIDQKYGSFADEHKLILKPNWKMFPNYAGVKRNTIMMEMSDIGVGFWDLDFNRGMEEVVVDHRFPLTKFRLPRSGTFDAARKWAKSGKMCHLYISVGDGILKVTLHEKQEPIIKRIVVPPL